MAISLDELLDVDFEVNPSNGSRDTAFKSKLSYYHVVSLFPRCRALHYCPTVQPSIRLQFIRPTVSPPTCLSVHPFIRPTLYPLVYVCTNTTNQQPVSLPIRLTTYNIFLQRSTFQHSCLPNRLSGYSSIHQRIYPHTRLSPQPYICLQPICFTFCLQTHLSAHLSAAHTCIHQTVGEKGNNHRILIGRTKGKRPFARPRHRWKDIKIDIKEI